MLRSIFVLILALALSLTIAHAEPAAPAQGASSEASSEASPKLNIPKAYLEQAQKDRAISNQIAVRFDRYEIALLQLEYEGQKNQTALIAATFVEDKCESEVSAKEWAERSLKDVSLCYKVQSLPRNFGAYTVVIEHHHVTEKTNTLINTYRFANPETFEEHRIAIPQAKAGANLYQIKVETVNKDGTKELSDGLSHLVLVQEDAVQTPKLESTVQADVRAFGETSVVQMHASSQVTFTLSEALDPALIQVSIQRRGAREFGKAVQGGLGSPFLADQNAAFGWTLLFRGNTEDAKPRGVTFSRAANGLWTVGFDYQGSLTSTHLPYRDAQDYQIDITHPHYAKRLASFECKVRAKINLAGQGTLEMRWPTTGEVKSTQIDLAK